MSDMYEWNRREKKELIEEFLEDLKSLLVGEWLDVYVKVKIEKWEKRKNEV